MTKRKLIITAVSALLLIFLVSVSLYGYVNNRFADVGNISITAKTDSTAVMSVDGVNYSEDLSLNQIKKAIVAKYQNFTFDSEGKFVNSEGSTIELSEDEVNEYLTGIEYAALTTTDGKNFFVEGKDGTRVYTNAQSGKYISFDLYFKSNRDYPFTLIFNTKRASTDGLSPETRIYGDPVNIGNCNLNGGYFSYNPVTGESVSYEATSELLVNPADSMRFSTTVDNQTKLYEPNIGLGSYATNIVSDDYESLGSQASRFDSEKNAGITYLRELGHNYLIHDYNDMPKAYQGFETVDAHIITNFEQRDEVKKVTFAFWCEGWDADCFQPIVGLPISVSLAFTGTDVIQKHTINYIDGENTNSIDYLVSNLYPSVTPYLPYKPGYIFEGWYTDINYNNLFDFSEGVTSLNQVRDAYAKWRQK